MASLISLVVSRGLLVLQPTRCIFLIFIILKRQINDDDDDDEYCGAFYNEFNILFCKDDFFVYPDMGLGSLKGLVICGDHIGLPDLSCCLHIVLCVSHACVYFISFDT